MHAARRGAMVAKICKLYVTNTVLGSQTHLLRHKRKSTPHLFIFCFAAPPKLACSRNLGKSAWAVALYTFRLSCYGSCLQKFASRPSPRAELWIYGVCSNFYGPTCENLHNALPLETRDIYPGAVRENMRASKIKLSPYGMTPYNGLN